MNLKWYLCIILFLIWGSIATAQDSTSILKKNKIHFDFGCGDYFEWPALTYPYDLQSYSVPKLLRVRRPDAPWLQSYWDLNNKLVTTNPIFHNAFYFDFKTNLKFDSLSVNAHLVAEHRGASAGVYSPDIMDIYPKFNFSYNHDFKLFGQVFNALGMMGNVDNERLMEGLTVYNVDVQEYHYGISLGNLSFNYIQIADLCSGIGLGIDDEYNYIFSLSKLKINPDYLLDIKADIVAVWPYENTGLPFENKNTYDFSLGLYNKNTRFYVQVSNRPFFKDFNRSSAALAGVKYGYHRKKLDIDLRAEARYYGSLYNLNFINTDVLYRKPENNNLYNSIGTALYPIQLYDRPFSQWAVFTEYQNKNVFAATTEITAKYYFYKMFLISANLDLTGISAETQPFFLYNFYTIGIGAHIDKINEFTVSLTNKAMNLDNHYMTFYMMTGPTILFKFVRKIAS